MSKILQWLSRWFAQPDKFLHFVVGAVCFFLTTVLTKNIPASGALRTSAILMVVAAIAYGKERYDKARSDTHTYDGWDAFATLFGGLSCALVLAMLAR